MTIAVLLKNLEPADDMSKEVIVEWLRPDGSVFQFNSLKGGAELTVHLHASQTIKLSERFVDRAKQFSP